MLYTQHNIHISVIGHPVKATRNKTYKQAGGAQMSQTMPIT